MLRCNAAELVKVCAIAVALTCAGTASAQEEGSIAGRLVDRVSGQPVADTEIRVRGVEVSASSNQSGWFLMPAVRAGRHQLELRRMGYEPAIVEVEVASGEMAMLDIEMVPAPLTIPGARAVAASPAPGAEVIEFAQHVVPGESAEELLRRVLGAQVFSGSGSPGSPSSIRLRGPTSISGSQEPLIVIDGIVTRGGLSDISAADVARIAVYRGAAAAAQFGSRGQAGVIEISTRRGGE